MQYQEQKNEVELEVKNEEKKNEVESKEKEYYCDCPDEDGDGTRVGYLCMFGCMSPLGSIAVFILGVLYTQGIFLKSASVQGCDCYSGNFYYNVSSNLCCPTLNTTSCLNSLSYIHEEDNNVKLSLILGSILINILSCISINFFLSNIECCRPLVKTRVSLILLFLVLLVIELCIVIVYSFPESHFVC